MRSDLLLFERMCVSDFAVMLHCDSRVTLVKARTENILTLCNLHVKTMHGNYQHVLLPRITNNQ